LRAERNGLEARGAGLVDGLGRHAVGQPGAPANLTPGIGPRTSLARVTENHLVDVVDSETGPIERRACGPSTELGRMRTSEGSAIPTNGRPCCSDDEHFRSGHREAV